MGITDLVVENFKCFERERISFGALTLLTGVNGMGKSTVLQALLLIRQSYCANLLPDFGLQLDGDYVRLGTAVDVLYDGARGDDADSVRMSVGFTGGEDLFFRFDASDKAANVMPVLDKRLPPESNSALLNTGGSLGKDRHAHSGSRFQYLAAERLGPREVHAVSKHHVDNLRDVGSDGSYAVAFLDAHGADPVHERMRRSDAASPQLLSQVTAWLGEVSPGVRISTLQYQELGRAAMSLSFVSGQATSRKLRATGVGFGVSYTLPVLVAILSSRPEDIILIENPEAHLHPRGQMALGGLLAKAASAGVQVLCETHSDHVLNGVRLAVKQRELSPEAAALHYFSRRDDGERIVHRVASPRIDSDGRIDAWPEGFFDQWDIALERLM